MTAGPDTRDTRLRELLDELELAREALRERRASSNYPWDPEPLAVARGLIERTRGLLPASFDPPVPADKPPAGQSLWWTPTDEALRVLEALQAAITTALKAAH